MTRRPTPSIVLGLLIGLWTPIASAQPPEVHDATELETRLANEARLSIELPDLGYTWSDTSRSGSPETGTLSVSATKVIYYFLHWGPLEVLEIDEDYVRERIPRVWPGEGLQVISVKEATVAGHPALFAEVMPQREFYRAFFLVWNCPESGRQFIADMNYNVRFHTPRHELEAEFATTEHTLACHPGAPTEQVPGHVVRYESDRFGLRFDHPLHWYVFESPYGVPHPEYRGRRSQAVGSLLAWMQDMTTEITFRWEALPEEPGDDTRLMGSRVDHYRAAIGTVRALEQVESFQYDDAETVTVDGRECFKLFGDVKRRAPAQPTPEFVADARAMVALFDDPDRRRRLQVVVLIDDYELDGQLQHPVRDIFDRWALELAEGLGGPVDGAAGER